MKNTTVDELIRAAVFSPDEKIRTKARRDIYKKAQSLGIFPASLHKLYRAFGKGKVKGFTVPAFNIRTLTYDTAAVIFSLAKKHSVGAFVFEIARSEIGYTGQHPSEYAAAVLAGAIKAGWKGPVFIQGDHYQFKASVYKEKPEEEIEKLKKLIKQSIEAHFYNIDIDASTLVDLEKQSLDDQQMHNYTMTARLTEYIRSLEPKNITVSIGGEIGHIGGKNSTVSDFTAFMDGYQKMITQHNLEGISKVSVQTGTSHGGIPREDGTIADVALDFSVLKDIGDVARNTYGLGGPVQHGASTLPNELFGEFPKHKTLEIHLATGFQNIVYDHLPHALKQEIYRWLKNHPQPEWKDSMTEEQNIYKTRKRALGPFKEKIWNLSDGEKEVILNHLENQFAFLFQKLNVYDTYELVSRYAA